MKIRYQSSAQDLPQPKPAPARPGSVTSRPAPRSRRLPPRAVVFDLGKVLLDFDYGIAARKIHSRSRLSAVRFLRLIDQSPLLFRYETGLLTTDEFFSEIRAASGLEANLHEFRELFGDIFTPIAPMIALHTQLRRQGVPAYIFSNTNELAVSHIRRRFPFFADFDGWIFSYEHRSMKPDPKLYEVVERVSRRSGNELLYIDDRSENVVAGAARGWNALLHQSPEKTWAAVQECGLIKPSDSHGGP